MLPPISETSSDLVYLRIDVWFKTNSLEYRLLLLGIFSTMSILISAFVFFLGGGGGELDRNCPSPRIRYWVPTAHNFVKMWRKAGTISFNTRREHRRS